MLDRNCTLEVSVLSFNQWLKLSTQILECCFFHMEVLYPIIISKCQQHHILPPISCPTEIMIQTLIVSERINERSISKYYQANLGAVHSVLNMKSVDDRENWVSSIISNAIFCWDFFFAAKYIIEEIVYVFFVIEYSDIAWDTHARTIARKAATASCQTLLQHDWLMDVCDTPSNINCFSVVVWKQCEQQWHSYKPFCAGTVVSTWSVWHGSMVQCERGISLSLGGPLCALILFHVAFFVILDSCFSRDYCLQCLFVVQLHLHE